MGITINPQISMSYPHLHMGSLWHIHVRCSCSSVFIIYKFVFFSCTITNLHIRTPNLARIHDVGGSYRVLQMSRKFRCNHKYTCVICFGRGNINKWLYRSSMQAKASLRLISPITCAIARLVGIAVTCLMKTQPYIWYYNISWNILFKLLGVVSRCQFTITGYKAKLWLALVMQLSTGKHGCTLCLSSCSWFVRMQWIRWVN